MTDLWLLIVSIITAYFAIGYLIALFAAINEARDHIERRCTGPIPEFDDWAMIICLWPIAVIYGCVLFVSYCSRVCSERIFSRVTSLTGAFHRKAIRAIAHATT